MSKSSKKNAKRAAKPLSDVLQGFISTVATCGFTTANAYAECVVAVRGIIDGTRPGSLRNRAMDAASIGYKGGYVARSLINSRQESWGNLTQLQQIEAGAEIVGKKPAKSEKRPDGTLIYLPDAQQPDGYRTEAEHKACRAADVSWFKVRESAGLTEPKKNKGGRKPRTGSNPPAAVPVDLVKASPTLETKEAVNDYFGTAAAALLATVDKNAKLVDPRISSAVTDFLTAVKAALGIK